MTPSELEEIRRELYPDELPSENRERFWEFVVPYFGLDESFQYTDDDIIEHLAAYNAKETDTMTHHDHATVAELIAYLSRMDPDTPVVLREDDAPADGPCVTLEDVLYELTPVSDDTRSYGPQGRR